MRHQKVISIWNPKGGQGKSLLAINLAAAAVEIGIRPLVIDQDPQGTARLYAAAGHLNFPVIEAVPTSRPDADLVIFDHQASDWEVPPAALLVMPVKPSRDQYSTYITANKRAQAAGKEIITVVTDGISHRRTEDAVMSALSESGAHVIPSSGVFSRASDEYRSIFDPALDSAYKIRERRRDISRILGAILLEEGEGAEAHRRTELPTAVSATEAANHPVRVTHVENA